MAKDKIVLLCKSGAAGRWPNDKDPTGMWLSEKLDGLRGKWDGKQFISRLGNVFPAPAYFTDPLPKTPLDGELWLGYGRFEETTSIVRNGSKDKGWNQLVYRVFDIPDPDAGPCETRWSKLSQMVELTNLKHLQYVEQTKCTGPQHLVDMMVEILAKGGEGVMLRKPGSSYELGRSGTIFKWKNFIDDEAFVVGYEEINVQTAANAHLEGATGKLLCHNPKLFGGQQFKVGSGLTDALRLNPPPLGTKITFRYQEVTGKNAVPRHARFIAVRDYE